MNQNIRYITEIAILTAMITVLGAIKIPNIIPGIEFQLSAPLAVAICAVFGFKKYIISGCLSSLIGLALGTQSILNVMIAMQFRLIVGLILWMCQKSYDWHYDFRSHCICFSTFIFVLVYWQGCFTNDCLSRSRYDFYSYYGTSICESIP